MSSEGDARAELAAYKDQQEARMAEQARRHEQEQGRLQQEMSQLRTLLACNSQQVRAAEEFDAIVAISEDHQTRLAAEAQRCFDAQRDLLLSYVRACVREEEAVEVGCSCIDRAEARLEWASSS
eukprot:GHVU01006307.1.p4 GENE.GHVU01006307.1~~GHVU01006307.1.p4  ORF type:complete len:124 (-),score=24.37 GHVU01006307.1:293-664(-)